MKHYTPNRAGLGGHDRVVVVGIGVSDAAAARRHAVEPALIERLEKYEKGARPRNLLRVEQLLAAAKLASCDKVLHIRDHHWDDGPGLRYTGSFGNHSRLHNLPFDLAEAGEQNSLASALRDQDSGGAHERIDDITHAKCELLHSAVHAGADDRFVQIRFGLRQLGFGTGFLGREKRRDPLLGCLLRSGRRGDRPEAPLHTDLEPLDVAKCHVTRIPSLELSLGLQFVHGLLVSASGLLNLTVSLYDVRLSHCELRLDLGNLPPRGLDRSFLFRAIKPEDRCPLCNRTTYTNVDFGDSSVYLGNNRDGSKEKRDVARRRVIVKDRRDQRHR